MDEDEPLIMEELERAIIKLKTRKAPGHNEITTKMIKYMGQTGKLILLDLLNKIQKKTGN